MSLPHRTAPLGHLLDGTPFWAYFGSEGDGDGDDGGGQGGGDGGGDGDEDDEDEDGDDGPDEDGLTRKGRAAIDRERTSAKRARERLKPWATLGREFGLTPEQVRERLSGGGKPNKSGSGSGGSGKDEDEQVDVEEIRRQATREANERVNTKLVNAAVTTAAADVLADPSDAVRFLDLSDYEVDEDGNVDAAQIKRDLKALLADKPYLSKARKGDGRNGGSPDYDGGSRRSGPGGPTMNDLIRRQAGIR